MTFTPQHSSPLARTISPFKDPRPPPCTPGKTAQIWDEYERRAVENAKRRETTPTSRRQAQASPRLSSGTVYNIVKSYDPNSSPITPSIKGSPRFDIGFPTRQPQLSIAEPTTVAICKTCKDPIRSTLGICEACTKHIVVSSAPGQATPPLTPTTQTFSGPTLPTSSSPKRRAHRPSASASASAPATHLFDPPIRLSSLKPPPSLQPAPSTAPSRPRKASLPTPAEMLPRPPTPRKSIPATPITPPSTSHSRAPSHTSPWATARPASLANITTPPTTAPATATAARHASATPSELSSLPSTSPPSLCRASYQLQTTMSSWEESDSEDEEKRGLVKYWRGRRWRGSIGGQGRRGSEAEGGEVGGGDRGVGARRRGFVRVISCGCDE